MTSPLLRPTASLVLDALTMDVPDGTVTLDSGAVPYGRATVTVPLVDPDDLEDIDPRLEQRATITAGDDLAVSRVFDLGLTGRRVDHAARTVTLDCATDEALLMRYAVLAADTGARALEGSLRDVVDYVLDKIGAELEPGVDDADVTAHWRVTNLIPNPSLEVDAANWIAGTGASSLTRIAMASPPAPSGAYALRWTAAAGISNVIPGNATNNYPVTPGRWYTFSAYIASNVARFAQPVIQWWTSNGTVLASQVLGATISTTPAEFRRVHVIAQAPPGATHGLPYVLTNGNAAGNLHFLDNVMFYEGNELIPYFDGNTPDDAGYTYEWANTAHGSASTRTPVVERLPELFTWLPGVTAWQFLEALTTLAGLRLFCDEHRRWYLIDPATWARPGALSITAARAKEGTDEITLGDPETYATGVVVHYRWEDTDGVRRERYDAAGVPGVIRIVEMDRPYPGPGTAAAILARMTGRGRVQDVTALAQWTADPGMEATITLPGTLPQAGQLAYVRWDLHSGLMDVRAAALIDVIPGSILALPGTIAALPGTIATL